MQGNRSSIARIGAIAILVAHLLPSPAGANHPVYVEGNCDSPAPGTTLVAPGTCGDFDGDGRIGTAEDTDGADRIFGTLTAALGPGAGAAAGTGANGNGTVIIVTSGRFAEALVLPVGPGGNLTLEAAPGVDADIDAVLQGDPAGGNNTRQGMPGIQVNMPADRRVTLRNLAIRNFRIGVEILGSSHVTLEGCRLENNLAYGVLAHGTARVLIDRTVVHATGFRSGSAGDAPSSVVPDPGTAISFSETAAGLVQFTRATSNFARGLENATGNPAAVCAVDVTAFDNAANFVNVDQAAACVDVVRARETAACLTPSCPTPVVQGAVRNCKKCKTRGDSTSCSKCSVELQ